MMLNNSKVSNPEAQEKLQCSTHFQNSGIDGGAGGENLLSFVRFEFGIFGIC